MTDIFHFLNAADMAATLALNNIHTPLSDEIWRFFSCQEIWYLLYAFILVLIIRNLGWKRGTVVALSIILTIVICDQLGNISKNFFQRLRPCWNPIMTGGGLRILEDRGGLYGFYSAHAANAAGFVICSSLGLRNDLKHNHESYYRIMACWFLLVGISRIFVGKHFLGDVVTGFAVGILVGYILGKLTSLLLNRSRLFLDQNQQENRKTSTR